MARHQGRIRLAADIGGTFTDIVLEAGERVETLKVLTTPEAPERAVVEGAGQVLAAVGLGFSDIDVFLHGTTLATNAIIERKGAVTGLIATAGFRDVIAIADESRYDQYDVFIEKREPLVPRHLRLTVPERLDVVGHVQLALDEAAVRAAALQLAQEGVGAVAVAFLHSYVDPVHERRAGEIIREVAPEMWVTLSSEVCPEAREYERTSTAIANAYVQPLMAGYLERLAKAFAEAGFANDIHLMTSGGSLASLETARRFPVRLIESGPAGGAILASHIAAERGEDRILSFDMGGTTAKICLIEDGEPLKARAFEVDRSARFMKGSGMPLRIPVIEMVEIGAGGGSIAEVDALGRIQVGPQSAGAQPGPACYGLGGERPTVTDGDVVLGKIDPQRFAGGKIALYADKAAAALEAHIGGTMRVDALKAAYGVAEIVDENMSNAARVHAVERGVAIGERTLIAFGGAAPLHAARLAEKLGISRIVVPAGAGVGSAIGFLKAPAAYELVRSRYMRLDQFDLDLINELLDEMSAEATARARSAKADQLEETRGAFMRYQGQGHEIEVALPARALTAEDAAALRDAFEAEYGRLYARHIPDAAIEIMSWRVSVSEAGEAWSRISDAVAEGATALPIGERDVFDAGEGALVRARIYARDDLTPGSRFAGPAIVVEDGTSTFASARFEGHVDNGGALVLTAKG